MYTFHTLNADGNNKFWRCANRVSDLCKARVHTNMQDIIEKRLGQHSHGSDAAAVEVAIVKTAIKKRAAQTMEQPSQIHNNAIQGIDITFCTNYFLRPNCPQPKLAGDQTVQ